MRKFLMIKEPGFLSAINSMGELEGPGAGGGGWIAFGRGLRGLAARGL